MDRDGLNISNIYKASRPYCKRTVYLSLLSRLEFVCKREKGKVKGGVNSAEQYIQAYGGFITSNRTMKSNAPVNKSQPSQNDNASPS